MMFDSTSRFPGVRSLGPVLTVFLVSLCTQPAAATVLFGLDDNHLGGRRWDADPRTFDLVGGPVERSLDGGLRWNVQGGSMQAFRDLFDWQDAVPSVEAFEQTIYDSFDAWLAVDPALGVPAPFTFVYDPDTPVAPASAGAEIDLFAAPTGQGPGITGGNADATFASGFVTLTSGTTNYPGHVMTGADIKLNNESNGSVGTEWTLPLFRKVLTHELGHALGLGDVDLNGHRFLDDNYDGTSSATALATLTNSFSQLVDVYDPSDSPLTIYNVPDDALGLEAPGVQILMESTIDLEQTGSLTADDFAGRQYLYPAVSGPLVPEPGSLWLAATALTALTARRLRTSHRRRSCSLRQRLIHVALHAQERCQRATLRPTLPRVSHPGSLADFSPAEL